MQGSIIIVNGASSAGKTTLVRAFQHAAPVPFVRFSFDLFLDGNALPMDFIRANRDEWVRMRPLVFAGMHQCLHALASTGNNVICDHIIENDAWRHDLITRLHGLDVYLVALHCSLPELERREQARGNRNPGEAANDFAVVHQGMQYDLELDSEHATADQNAQHLFAMWQKRHIATSSALARIAATLLPTT
jgi:chloramphenicol 3-O phosphotransferase